MKENEKGKRLGKIKRDSHATYMNKKYHNFSVYDRNWEIKLNELKIVQMNGRVIF